jgi:octaprenyl-diphosphate synthase
VIHELRRRHGCDLAAVEQLMLTEVGRWQWEGLEPLRDALVDQLRRPGKRLRPLLALSVSDAFAADPSRVHAGAAAAELCHVASVIYDDVEDNSTTRTGQPTAHVATTVSLAINMAGIIRSLSYHVIDNSCRLTLAEKFQLHRLLDATSTLLPLGQSMDIGWHAGWYRTVDSAPYDVMVERKTGALFKFAGWTAAWVCSGDERLADEIGSIAGDAGVLYQRLDDYLDGSASAGAAVPDDLMHGKLTYPMLVLSASVTAQDEAELLGTLLQRLRGPSPQPEDGNRLAELVTRHRVPEKVRSNLLASFHELQERIDLLTTNLPRPESLRLFLSSLQDLLVSASAEAGR